MNSVEIPPGQMPGVDVLIADLLLDAGHLATSLVNAFDEPLRKKLAAAMAGGGRLEARVLLATPARVSLHLTNPETDRTVELIRTTSD